MDLSNHSFGKEQDGRYLFDTSLWAALEEDDAQQEDDEDKIETVPFGASAPRTLRAPTTLLSLSSFSSRCLSSRAVLISPPSDGP